LDIRDYRERFEKMSIDELWALHVEVGKILADRLSARKAELEVRLEQLSRTTERGGSSED
jgi:DNA-binding protein H-NS